MGKAKRPARKHSNHHDNPKSAKNAVVRRQHSQKPPQHAKKAGSARGNGGPPVGRIKVPFSKHDNVLLVGEGDFSFSLSLLRHHRIGQLTATCYDSREALESKYPGVEKTIQYLQGVNEPGSPRRDDSADVSHGREGHEGQWEGFSPSPPASPSTPEQKPSKEGTKKTPVNILYGIDATKLSTVHKKALRPYSPFTKIVFNFPHVGGLSTDVNRQVRYNQELLVGFFKSAKGLLSSPSNPARVLEPDKEAGSDHEDDSESSQDSAQHPGAVDGQILVTLFEGEPYTLWNIRDLARHCNLKVVESFKFSWSAYPGYQHARTIGEIISGKDRSAEGKRKGAWRGEERDARCYIVADQDAETDVRSSQKKRKRGQDDEDDSD